MNYYAQFTLTGSDVQLNTIAANISNKRYIYLNFTAIELVSAGVHKEATVDFLLYVYSGNTLLGTYTFKHDAGVSTYQGVLIDISDIIAEDLSTVTLWLNMDRTDSYTVYFTVKDTAVATLPLEIDLVDENGTTAVYLSRDAVTTTKMLPDNETAPGRGTITNASLKVSTYSSVRLGSGVLKVEHIK